MQQVTIIVDGAFRFPFRPERKEETLYQVTKSDVYIVFHLSLRSALNSLFSTYASRRSQLCSSFASLT